MKLKYNSPVILTYTAIAFVVFLIDAYLVTDFSKKYFSITPTFSFSNPMDYFRMISHTMGHAGWQHFFGNIMLIAVIGPILEEKYSSGTTLSLLFFTAIFSGLYTVLFSSVGMYGGSGIVFALIVAASISNSKDGEIPLTFILVMLIFILKEVVGLFENDGISHIGHLIGGCVGAFFGFVLSANDKADSQPTGELK